MKKWINVYILGRPQPVRLHKKVSRLEKMKEFAIEWKNAIIGFVIAFSIILLYVPFL